MYQVKVRSRSRYRGGFQRGKHLVDGNRLTADVAEVPSVCLLVTWLRVTWLRVTWLLVTCLLVALEREKGAFLGDTKAACSGF